MLESSSSSDEEEDCASSVETSSSEETVATQVIKNEYQKRIVVMNHQALLGMAWSFGQTEKEKREKRVKVDGEVRERPWRFIESWSDKMFRAQFRLSRRDFDFVLSRLISTYAGPHDTGKSTYRYACSRGDRSSGAHTKLKINLCVTLRLLAGGLNGMGWAPTRRYGRLTAWGGHQSERKREQRQSGGTNAATR